MKYIPQIFLTSIFVITLLSTGLHAADECSGEIHSDAGDEIPVVFEVTQPEHGFGRILLLKENNAPKLWSAVGLDFRNIGFGDSEVTALAAFVENVELDRKIRSTTNLKSNKSRLNANTLNLFNGSSSYDHPEYLGEMEVRRISD